jgi:hypothetical protein
MPASSRNSRDEAVATGSKSKSKTKSTSKAPAQKTGGRYKVKVRTSDKINVNGAQLKLAATTSKPILLQTLRRRVQKLSRWRGDA